jgi:serine protease AprX
MKIAVPFLLITIAFNQVCQAQFSRYIIRLKNKSGSPYSVSNPPEFLSQRAIERRIRYGINIDSTDLPVNPAYLDSIRSAGNVTVLNTSKWFNQVCIKTTDAAALSKINSFPFVISSSPIAARPFYAPVNKKLDSAVTGAPTRQRPMNPTNYYDYGTSYDQVHLHNGEFLHNHGFKGEGMQLAVMDAGFTNYLSLPTFDSIRKNKQVIGTWDFVNNKLSVNDGSVHGLYCFSTIAANMPGLFIGTAPRASFYLFRTEDPSSEYPVEEQNITAAFERADSSGADLFSVSLGYSTFDNSSFNYTYADMNGHTTLSARATNMAFNKGIMVVVAAGNEGQHTWKNIITPADADNALTVGAVSVNRQPANFSSYGPSSDGQIKPDVAAVGVNAVIANINTGQASYGAGTSYATPIMAGITTCLWQAFPKMKNSDIISVLRQSGDRTNNPDDRTGYGIPDVKKAFVLLVKKGFTSQVSMNGNCEVKLSWTAKTASDMSLVVERKLPIDNGYIVIDTKTVNTDFSEHDFTFTDNLSSLEEGTTIQYRIRMDIASDTSFYLDSSVIEYTHACVDEIKISPNPVDNDVTVLIRNQGQANVSISIQNVNGQQVYKLSSQIINDLQAFKIPAKRFSSGVYFVTVWIDNKRAFVKRFVKR